ncbi:MAG: hypothetical protein U5K70_02540 [Halodesulfurarchaeum sp.]|nr:hypothetical protein [Halodesulfurarchaeum sp.]
MTEVELTPQADEQLAALEAKTRERLLKKLAEAQDWTDHHLDRLAGRPYYKLRPETTGRSSTGTEKPMCFGSSPSAIAETYTIAISRRDPISS